MPTCNYEDIIRTAGLALLRDAPAKDMRSLDALFPGKAHSCSKQRKLDQEGDTMISQNKEATKRIRGPDDVRLSVSTSRCFLSN